jgi:segregation and condensation protein B
MSSTLVHLVESVLFLENEGLSLRRITKLTDSTELEVQQAIDELTQIYKQDIHGIELIVQAGEYQFSPKEHLWEDLKEQYGKRVDKRLSRAALETLSIIAYSQPITKKEVDSIRGLASDTIIRLLRDKELIKPVGFKEGPGKPILYGTTKTFLTYFDLPSISSLPKLSELDTQRFESDE